MTGSSGVKGRAVAENEAYLPSLTDALHALGLQGAVLEAAITSATDSHVWRVRYRGRSLAIRVYREEQRSVMAGELNAMALVSRSGIPVPALVASSSIDGRYPAMALTWMPGEPVAEAMLRQPNLASRLGRESGQVLARLHQIPTEEAVDRGEIGSSWIHRGTPAGSELGEILLNLSVARASLLHLDYHPFNLLATGGQITGVLDWTNAAAGDPRADVARTVSILRLVAPALTGKRGSRRMTIGRFTRGFLAGYCAGAGPLIDMEPFYAWAGGMLLRDLGLKLDSMPITRPDALRLRIEEWTAHWQQRAGG